MRRPSSSALRVAIECVIVFCVTYSLTVATACAAPGILGGPTAATTSRVCSDGTTCPNWLACPNLESPGRCEAPSDPAFAGARDPDAGGDAAP
jgi:hypothetical protein